MLLMPLGFMVPAAPVAVAGGLLLDGIATVAALSVRKLVSAYAGPCLRVRRDSDNAEQDIGFVSGALDSAAMLAFCGGASGYVPKWYDQSGAGNHATQASAANQYQAVASGAAVAQGGRPCLGAGAGAPCMALPSGMFAGLSSSTAFCAFSQAAGHESGWWAIGGSNLNTHTPYSDNNAYEQYLATTRPAFGPYPFPTSQPTVHTAQNDGATLSVFRNGTQAGAAQAIAFTNAPAETAGRPAYSQVNLSEIILTAAAPAVATRRVIERSMGAYYGIIVA